jgi:aldehyde dehydrogenase family 7 protein A1
MLVAWLDARVFLLLLPYVILTTNYLAIPHTQASPAELHGALERTREAYVHFRSIPAPKRGEIIRQIRVALAAKVRRYNYAS